MPAFNILVTTGVLRNYSLGGGGDFHDLEK